MALTAQTKDSLVIDVGIISPVEFIPDPPVSHIRMDFMDLLNLLGDLPVRFFIYAFRFGQPPVIRRAWNMKVTAKPLHGVRPFFRELPDRLVLIQVASQR